MFTSHIGKINRPRLYTKQGRAAISYSLVSIFGVGKTPAGVASANDAPAVIS
jgi:hypothetical protein